MVKLYNSNCLDILKEMESDSVDLVVTDPPYRVTSRGSSGSMGGYWKTELSKDGKIFENNDIQFNQYIPELYRVLKPNTHCYIMVNNINLQECLNEVTKCDFKFVKDLIWDKGNKICGRFYMSCFEHILMFRKGGERPINFPSTPDILSVPIKKLKDADGHNLHDTEKPVRLMEELIKNSSNEGDIVLDPFMGIGATGVACKNLNRSFVGCEINPKYFEYAKQRIEGDTPMVVDHTKSSLW